MMMPRRGDGLRRPLNAPSGQAALPGIQPGTSGIEVVNRLIVAGPGGGVFIYNGTPGPNNLLLSQVAAATTDPFLNVVPAGFTWYSATSPGLAENLQFGGQFNCIHNAAGATKQSGAWITDSTFFNDVNGFHLGPLAAASIYLGGTQWVVDASQTILPGLILWTGTATAVIIDSAGVIHASQPGASSLTQETWHTLAPAITGYTVNQCRYKLSPEGQTLFDLQLTANAGGGTAGTYVLTSTLPAAYQPAGSSARAYPVGYNATLVAGANFGWLSVDEASSGSAGRVRLQIPGLAAGTTIGTTAVVPLD